MVTISPSGLSTTALVANELSLLATFKTKINHLCNLPQAVVTYSNEAPTLNGTTVFVPVVARISLANTTCNGKLLTQNYIERFIVAFQGQTALPAGVTINSVGRLSNVEKQNCYKVFVINDSLTITLA